MSVWRSRTIPRFYMWCSMKFSSKRVSTCCSFFIYVVLRRHRQLQSSGVCPRTTNVLRCSWTYSDRLAVFVFEVVAFSEVLETVSHVALRLSFRVVQRLLSKELCLRNFFFFMFIERSSIVPTIIWHGMQIYINFCAIGCESHTFWCILYKLHSYNLSSYDSGTGMLASWRL